uniref:S4 RNA-binding domain-containing protein n=1 Tax=Angiostrongylus cantonensis TaxID=6313 RepID=A0A158P7W2_ANGCA
MEELGMKKGIRYLAPYWAVYRTRAKGRWVGRRMVDVFAQEFLSLNRNYPKIACKLGRIYINGKQMLDVDYVLRNGDSIHHWGHRHEHPVLDLPLNIIAETDDLLVINKPPSLPVHACGQYAIHTVLGQLRYNHNRSGLRVLHRLDRTTSGVLLFAKNYETDIEFKKTLKEGTWIKEYLCMVEGVFPDEEVDCNEPIGVLVISMGIQCVRADGKPARSLFKKLWSDGKRSVLSVKLYTGRTHQIRVHAQFLGELIISSKVIPLFTLESCRLCDDVRNAHKCSNWHETIDPEYELRMAKMADEEVKPEPYDFHSPDRPLYDPICLNCNVVKREVPRDHFQLYLHCLRYSTEKWSYSTPIPEWAIDAAVA